MSQINMSGCPTNRLQVRATNRKRQQMRIIAVNNQFGVPITFSWPIQNWLVIALMVGIPEVDTDAFQFAGVGTADAHVSIAPLGGVLRANIIASNKSYLAINGQNF